MTGGACGEDGAAGFGDAVRTGAAAADGFLRFKNRRSPPLPRSACLRPGACERSPLLPSPARPLVLGARYLPRLAGEGVRSCHWHSHAFRPSVAGACQRRQRLENGAHRPECKRQAARLLELLTSLELWARYEYPYPEYSVPFEVAVEQGGRTIFQQFYGRRGASRLWFFGRPDGPWQDFPNGVSLSLSRTEAEYLRERIISERPHSLLATLPRARANCGRYGGFGLGVDVAASCSPA